jgi:hypothetical protein
MFLQVVHEAGLDMSKYRVIVPGTLNAPGQPLQM